MSWFVSRRLTAPLEVVSLTTRQLAAGNYQVVVPPTGTTELDMLATDVNQLASELDTTEKRRLTTVRTALPSGDRSVG